VALDSKATLLAVYPVGCIYTSIANTDPATLFGGSWVAFGAGRVLVGIDAGQSEFNAVEETGGSKTHTLTTNEIPPHTHAISASDYPGGAGALEVAGGYPVSTQSTQATGGGAAHNNLQPYIVVYMFKRTA
jgi:microcystin-dependent protein